MNLNIKKILVPTDFSKLSLDVLNYAGHIAKKFDAEIIVMHVMEFYEHNSALGQIMDYPDLIEIGIKKKLSEIEATNTDFWGVRTKTKAVKGKIHKEIKEYVKKENIDLIIMGTHGASGTGDYEKYVLGSNAYRVVYSIDCPVVTIKHSTVKVEIKKILLPLDVSKATTQKVDCAIEWAKLLGSTIHAVAVSSFLDEYKVDISDLEFQLQKVIDKIKRGGVNVEAKMIRHDNISHSVLEYSKEIKPDLTMIMTRQESKLNDLLMGSSARKVISESDFPVLSLRPNKK